MLLALQGGPVRTEDLVETKADFAADARLRLIFEQAPNAMALLIGPDHVFELVNPVYRQMIAGRDVVGRPVREALPELEGQGYFELLDRVFTSGETYSARDLPIMLASGRGTDVERRFIDLTYKPLRDADGTVIGVLAEGYDVTVPHFSRREVRAAEQRRVYLAELSEQLREIPDGDDLLAFAAEVLGRTLDIRRAGFGEVSEDGDWLLVRRDWTNGAASLVGRHPLTHLEKDIIGKMNEGSLLSVEDRDTDDIAPARRQELTAVGARAMLSVPIVEEGALVALFYLHHDVPRRWTPSDRALARDVAERAWAALMRARSDAALRETVRELEFALHAGRFGAWSLSLPGEDLTTSETCRTIFGRDPALDFSYAELQAAIHPDDLPAMLAAVQKSIATGADYDIEYRVVTPSGEVRWVGIRAQPAHAENGAAVRLTGVSLDVTERKHAEGRRQALIELGDRLRDIEDPADLSFAAAEILGRTLGVSRVGYGSIDPVAETISIERDWNAPGIQSLAGVLRFRDYGTYIEDLKRGEAVVFADAEKDPRTTNGAAALKAINARSVVNMPLTEQGGFVALLYLNNATVREWTEDELSFIRDVAERTRMAVERRRAEQDLKALAETLERQVAERTAERDRMWRNSRDLLVVVGSDGVMRAVNPAWQAVLGHSPADVVGNNFREFVWREDAAATEAAFAASLKDDVNNFETRFIHRDGTPRWVAWSTSVEGDLVFAYGRHVTAEKLQAEALLQAQEALRQSQKLEAMGQLTGGVAHDFNNLLTPIIGGLDRLHRRGLGDERDRRLIDGALQSAERAKTLVQRLLAFARRQPLQPNAVDVAKVVAGMRDLIASTSGPQIRVQADLAPDLPLAQADLNQLEMAILNLSVNARDAMPDGGLLTIAAAGETVGAGHRSGLPPGAYVRLSVGDTGVGMDETTLARSIEPFFSTKGIGKGTGLGLSMVHGLASQLGGALTLSSRPGLGTTVELWLPVSAETEAAEGATAGLGPEAATVGAALLVDDEDLVRASTADMLSELGYRVVEVASAEAALRALDGGLRVDLVVTDHLMPGMTGVDLAYAIRERRPGMPVLLVSGFAESEGVAPDLPRLTKPFRQSDLAASLAALGSVGQ